MANWTFRCGNCHATFVHSQVEDKGIENYFWPQKPDFPLGGSEIECPNCRQKATYQQHALTYQV
jgi:DNA-directed RNA polymerase subunit RPC12/RpoP